MLFSILYIESKAGETHGSGPSNITHSSAGASFLKLAGKSLIAGGYQKARPYSVEAVVLYALCKFFFNNNPDEDSWLLMGISARLAVKMGYHRNPKHFPHISPFQGEIRRRTFYIVSLFNTMLSFQSVLPAVIQGEECDTKDLSNLLDTDFDEDCKELPTPTLYYCYKSRLGKIFRRVTRHALALKTPSYEETMKLDRELHLIHEEVPPSLRWRSISSSYTDDMSIIMGRLNIDLMHQECICALHRHYLSHQRTNPEFAYSRRTCSDAALQLLQLQSEMHAAFQPGGRWQERNWSPTIFATRGFLLGAMVLCLDLYEARNRSEIPPPTDLGLQVRKFDALKLSYEIWLSRSQVSSDARRACNVLAAMLSKVSRPSAADPMQDVTDGQTTSTPMDWSQVVGICLPSPSRIESNNGGIVFISDPRFTDPLDSILSENENVDWVRKRATSSVIFN